MHLHRLLTLVALATAVGPALGDAGGPAPVAEDAGTDACGEGVTELRLNATVRCNLSAAGMCAEPLPVRCIWCVVEHLCEGQLP